MIGLKLLLWLYLFWPLLLLLVIPRMGIGAGVLHRRQLLSWWATMVGWARKTDENACDAGNAVSTIFARLS